MTTKGWLITTLISVVLLWAMLMGSVAIGFWAGRLVR
jgi:hypothetical protein